MKLSQIEIRNFKGLQHVTLEPANFACLVGENNSGKSSVLQAVVRALNRTGQLPQQLYYDAGAPVEFALRFEDVTEDHLLRLAEEHRPRIADILENDVLELVVRFPPEEKCQTTAIRKVPTDPSLHDEAIADLLKGKKAPNVAQTARENLGAIAEGMDDQVNITQAKEYLREQISHLPDDQLERAEVPLPTGIASSISNLIPEPIYVPAVKNLIDDLKTTQSTPFGRLIGLLLESMAPALEQVNQSLRTLDAMLNRVEVDGTITDGRHPSVSTLERLIEDYLKANFPNIALELIVPPPELKSILNSAEILIDDGSKDSVESKGDGIKRSLTFAILQAYVHQQKTEIDEGADVADAPAKRPLIFLFEEPELFLHPRSQKVLFETLSKLSSDSQVILTTHSPIFFAPGSTACFVRVAKEAAEPKPIGKLYPVRFDLDPSSAEAFRLTRFENADAAFFSREVVLFEGESDDVFCKHVAKLLNDDWDFDARSIALVRVSGKGNFAKFRSFFEAFGLRVKIVGDLDCLFEGYKHLGASADLAQVRAAAIEAIDAIIAEQAIPAEPSSSQIKDKVHQASWKQRYGRAKVLLRELQQGKVLEEDDLATFDRLFTWENDIARTKACRENADARVAILPLLDGLRAEGIAILSNGAIEAYYPNEAQDGPKPQRALTAIQHLKDREDVEMYCPSLEDGRQCELHEIFEQLFTET